MLEAGKGSGEAVTAEDRLCIAIVNWKSADLVAHCLRGIGSTWPVVVVDNDSPDRDHLEVLLAGTTGVDLVPLTRNVGYGGGMNAALKWAEASGYSHVLMMNPDAVPTPTIIVEMFSARASYAVVGIRQAQERPGQPSQEYVVAADLHRARPIPVAVGRAEPSVREVDVVTGAGILVAVEAARSVGYIDEDYFHYKEEFDFGYRLARNYGKAALVQSVVLPHVRGGSLGGATPAAAYYRTRNELLFLAKNFGRFELLRMPGLILSSLKESLNAPRSVRSAIRAGWRDGISGRTGPVDRR